MLRKSKIWGSVIGLGLLLGIASGVNAAEQMRSHHSEQTSQFRRIEQPLGLKVAISLGGLGLIALELWWFLFSKTPAQQSIAERKKQELKP